MRFLVSSIQISCVNLFFHIREDILVAVCHNYIGAALKLLQVVDHKGAEEGGAVLQGWLVDNNFSALCLDSFHNALNGGLAEVIRICLHSKAANTYRNRLACNLK